MIFMRKIFHATNKLRGICNEYAKKSRINTLFQLAYAVAVLTFILNSLSETTYGNTEFVLGFPN